MTDSPFERPRPTEWADRGPAPLEGQSVVDRHSTFNGHYESSRNLLVEGRLEGEVSCQGTITVAEKATVSGTVSAHDILVAGTLEGTITCEGRLRLEPTGRVNGDATVGRLIIEDGAVYNGELHMAADASGVTSFRPRGVVEDEDDTDASAL